ncbi:MAG: aminotransferase class I/II-fold pyridoxal phosphate-dependent enzyme [Fimbriimonas sp.]|nr:aminotransferase class I/II-fold pyridoxal phosphate-dependent enzyme [Fimbriimonas sp.]
MKPLARTVSGVTASGIRRYFDLAATVEGVVSLGVGEPKYPCPPAAKAAAIAAIESDDDAYTSNFGRLSFRKAISDEMKRLYGVSYRPETEILVTTGVSEGADLALRAILEEGDEVIVTEPAYVSYGPTVTFVGGKVIALSSSAANDFEPDPDAIRKAVTNRTKAIVLGYPSNPTGATPSREVIEAILAIAIEHDLWLISDEIYGRLVYGVEHTCVSALPGAWERTIMMGGFSKAYAMTGWRIGYACAPAAVIEVMMKVHQYTMLCAPTISQIACEAALRHSEKDVETLVAAMEAKRNYFVSSLNELGLECRPPKGSFYAFPSVAKSGLDSETFTERLLKEHKVLVVPGTAFCSWSGDETTGRNHVRCCYAVPDEDLQKAVERMAQFMKATR